MAGPVAGHMRHRRGAPLLAGEFKKIRPPGLSSREPVSEIRSDYQRPPQPLRQPLPPRRSRINTSSGMAPMVALTIEPRIPVPR